MERRTNVLEKLLVYLMKRSSLQGFIASNWIMFVNEIHEQGNYRGLF
jgi:hypothetical protein